MTEDSREWMPIDMEPKDGRIIEIGRTEDGKIKHAIEMQWRNATCDSDTFIYGASGRLTTDTLVEIEKQILDLDNDDAAALFERGPGQYLLSASRIEGQHGPQGQCELPPYWELSIEEFRALAYLAERPAAQESSDE